MTVKNDTSMIVKSLILKSLGPIMFAFRAIWLASASPSARTPYKLCSCPPSLKIRVSQE